MRLKKGFTLIELLVVISIIAMLLAILMPALGAVKERARSVVDRANLHQWGLCYQLYTSDYDGALPTFVGGSVGQTTYMESLRPYYDDINKMRTCPSAPKIYTANPTGGQPLSFFGSTEHAWQVDSQAAGWMNNKDWGIGSYTENSWIRGRENSPNSWASLTAMKRPSDVPLIGDGRWNNAWPEDNRVSEVASELEFYNIGNWASISCYVMRRHGDGINMAMADMSAIGVDAEELWDLKWHKTFKKSKDVDLSWMDW